jgi:hypothetical protein
MCQIKCEKHAIINCQIHRDIFIALFTIDCICKKDHLFFPKPIDLTHGAFFYSHYKISNGPISISLTRQFTNAHEVLIKWLWPVWKVDFCIKNWLQKTTKMEQIYVLAFRPSPGNRKRWLVWMRILLLLSPIRYSNLYKCSSNKLGPRHKKVRQMIVSRLQKYTILTTEVELTNSQASLQIFQS